MGVASPAALARLAPGAPPVLAEVARRAELRVRAVVPARELDAGAGVAVRAGAAPAEARRAPLR